ncbi:metallophosphoesterase family protein [uncultured Campylobacter sp.]|uniref:metallophosphoesterase family protein n=1 Tax=uncultured Campylobacter sp. TaxID=218934 RepID=UPI002601A213|nr:metallophosphoesterase family protein [uncultured Campylobacter sp.]
MIIGVISDSHRETEVAASAIEWLLARGADLLVHAEGIVASETLRLLRQSGKPYFAVLGNNDEALTEFKNQFNLRSEPFCTEFAGLRLKIMHHPFYLFDEESAAQNEADGLNLDADLGAGADRVANFRKDFGADLVKNSSFSIEVSCGTNLGSNCRADRREILISNYKAADCAANLDANSNGADDEILNGGRGADVNFKNIRSASANLKSGWSSASPNVNLGLNAGADVNSNANLDLNLDADLASSPNANLNSNASANLATNTSPDMNSKVSSSTDCAVNLTAPSLSANLSAPNSCSNLTANSELNAGGESKNRGLCERGADKIPTIKIYDHTHYFAAAVDKNGALVLNPGEICGRKKRLFGLPALWYKSENCAYFVSARSAKNYKATERKS